MIVQVHTDGSAVRRVEPTPIKSRIELNNLAGGKILWQGPVQIDLNQDLADPFFEWYLAKLITYPALPDRECIDVLQIAGWKDGVTYYNLNNAVFSSGLPEDSIVRLDHYTAVQRAVNGNTYDINPEPLIIRVIGPDIAGKTTNSPPSLQEVNALREAFTKGCREGPSEMILD